MEQSAQLVIRFLRECNESKKNTDDVIQIRKVGTVFRLTIKFSNTVSGDPVVRIAELPTLENVVSYCMSLLSLMLFDSDPFKSVQIDMPYAPSVLINTANLCYALPTIQETLKAQLNVLSGPTTTPKHIFFDDCGRVY